MGWIKEKFHLETSKQKSFEQSFSDNDYGKEILRLPFSSFQVWIQPENISNEAKEEILEIYQLALHSGSKIHSFQKRIADYQQRLQHAKELVQTKELEYSQFQLEPEMQHLLEVKQRRDKIQVALWKNRDVLDAAFLVLRQVLERSENSVFNSQLFSEYFFAPLPTLLADKELAIVLQVKALQAALNAQQLVVPLKEFEQVYTALQTLEASAITVIQQECLGLQQELSALAQEITRKDLLQKLDDVDYWLKHHQQQAAKLEKDIFAVEKEIQDAEELRYEQVKQLELLTSQALQRKVVVVV